MAIVARVEGVGANKTGEERESRQTVPQVSWFAAWTMVRSARGGRRCGGNTIDTNTIDTNTNSTNNDDGDNDNDNDDINIDANIDAMSVDSTALIISQVRGAARQS